MENPPTFIRMPAYLADFRCLGPACPDHCCYGWDIFVDRSTCQRYRKTGSSSLTPLFEQAIHRNRKDPSDARYARIRRSGEDCPFLNRDRLCRIQAELGEAFLPDVCAVFPRRFRSRRNGIAASASLACPEIARLALEAPEGIEMIEMPVDAAPWPVRAVDPPLSSALEEAGTRLNAFAAALLKDRRRELWQRLFSLGVLLEAAAQASPRGIPALVDAFSDEMQAPAFAHAMENAPVLTGLQLQIVQRLHAEIIKSVRVQAFRDCAAACFAGLGTNESGLFDERIGRRYDRVFDESYGPFFQRHAHLLENYLVNDLLHHDLGFQQGRQLYETYVTMALNFAMLKTYLIGQAAFYGRNFSPEQAIRMIYAFTKVIEPDAAFRRYALNLLAESGCTDMLHMAVLLRN